MGQDFTIQWKQETIELKNKMTMKDYDGNAATDRILQ